MTEVLENVEVFVRRRHQGYDNTSFSSKTAELKIKSKINMRTQGNSNKEYPEQKKPTS